MSPVRVTAQQYSEKWARRISQSTEDVRNGVNRVSVSPTSQAAESQDKWLAGIQRAASSGKWAGGLRRVSLDDWKRSMIEKGLNRIAPGAEAARAKVTDMANDLLGYENRVLEEIDRMPDLTIEHSIARATTWIRRMAAFQRA